MFVLYVGIADVRMYLSERFLLFWWFFFALFCFCYLLVLFFFVFCAFLFVSLMLSVYAQVGMDFLAVGYAVSGVCGVWLHRPPPPPRYGTTPSAHEPRPHASTVIGCVIAGPQPTGRLWGCTEAGCYGADRRLEFTRGLVVLEDFFYWFFIMLAEL